jgi:hypothetical protein
MQICLVLHVNKYEKHNKNGDNMENLIIEEKMERHKSLLSEYTYY